jgi:pyridoxamine 5'-phosphate oxidase
VELHYLDKSPFRQFHDWFKEAELKSGQRYANAMTLATSSPDGIPSVRVVLLKGFSEEGFVFYTNYDSRKGTQLAQNPRAALCFFWDALRRQVRAEGQVERVSREDSQEYFSSRPRGAQIGAWASEQSSVIPSRDYLEERARAAEERFRGMEQIPVPDRWGGFLFRPTRIEFWQEGDFRLHDRFLYEKDADGAWGVKRLAP